MNKPGEKTHFSEVCHKIDEPCKELINSLLTSENLITSLAKKLKGMLEKGKDSKETIAFKYGLMLKFLYSCLIDADRLSTANFECPEQYWIRNNQRNVQWKELIDALDLKLKEFAAKTDRSKVDEIRAEVLL